MMIIDAHFGEKNEERGKRREERGGGAVGVVNLSLLDTKCFIIRYFALFFTDLSNSVTSHKKEDTVKDIPEIFSL